MAPRAPRRTPRTDPRALAVVAALVLAALAWVGVVAGHAATRSAHGHHGATTATTTTTVTVALAWWTLMALAMMLPPALPLLGLLVGLLAGRRRVAFRLLVALAAFVGVWVVVGAVLVTGAAVVGTLLGDTDSETRARLAGGVVVVAGLYQFTPVKDACLTACRSPRWFALRLWGRRGPTSDAASVAGAYGVSCVGCCWALMVLCLGTGALALPVMVTLAVVMAAERLAPGARVLARATGVVLVLLGMALFAGLLPPALVHPLLGA